MSSHNHLRLLEQYQQHADSIHSLMESMMTSLGGEKLLNDRQAQQEAVERLSRYYPFVELIYSLDAEGIQLMDSVYGPHVSERSRRPPGQGNDRSHRPYVAALRASQAEVVVTRPYLSSATHRLAVSAAQRFLDGEGRDRGFLVINFNLQKLIAYLNGDALRSRVHPLFQGIYGLIGALLVLVAALLLYSAVGSLIHAFSLGKELATGAFGIVILITLGLAIFDLGKTILEEEVLTAKDIHHSDSTRRTITRFMSAIVIAVSIEALLLMFKSLLGGGGEQVVNAVWMLMAAVALLAGLGVYLKLSRE